MIDLEDRQMKSNVYIIDLIKRNKDNNKEYIFKYVVQ